MKFPIGIEVSEPVNRGSFTRYSFNIIDSNQEFVLKQILSWIKPNIKIFFSDHRRNDFEGGVIVSYHNKELRYMRGGHGYSSDWYISKNNKLFIELIETVKATKYGNILGHGSIDIYNS